MRSYSLNADEKRPLPKLLRTRLGVLYGQF